MANIRIFRENTIFQARANTPYRIICIGGGGGGGAGGGGGHGALLGTQNSAHMPGGSGGGGAGGNGGEFSMTVFTPSENMEIPITVGQGGLGGAGGAAGRRTRAATESSGMTVTRGGVGSLGARGGTSSFGNIAIAFGGAGGRGGNGSGFAGNANVAAATHFTSSVMFLAGATELIGVGGAGTTREGYITDAGANATSPQEGGGGNGGTTGYSVAHDSEWGFTAVSTSRTVAGSGSGGVNMLLDEQRLERFRRGNNPITQNISVPSTTGNNPQDVRVLGGNGGAGGGGIDTSLINSILETANIGLGTRGGLGGFGIGAGGGGGTGGSGGGHLFGLASEGNFHGVRAEWRRLATGADFPRGAHAGFTGGRGNAGAVIILE